MIVHVPMSRVCRTSVPLLVLVMAWAGCGEDGTGRPDGTTYGPLVFTREDGSVVDFSAAAETLVWCGPWESEEVPIPSLNVLVLGPEEASGWQLQAVLGDVTIGDSLRFPNYFTWNQPDSVNLFLLDPPNELSTDTEESSGFIVFHRLPCPTGRTVEFSIDAVMGSEYGSMPPVAVRGRFAAQVTGAPQGRARMLGRGCQRGE